MFSIFMCMIFFLRIHLFGVQMLSAKGWIANTIIRVSGKYFPVVYVAYSTRNSLYIFV